MSNDTECGFCESGAITRQTESYMQKQGDTCNACFGTGLAPMESVYSKRKITLSSYASERSLFAKAVAVYVSGFMEAEPRDDDLDTAEWIMSLLEGIMGNG